MTLYGRIVQGTRTLKETKASKPEEEGLSFHQILESNFITLCKELEIPVPIWMEKNTKEFVRHRRTTFDKEHFVENILFDRFEIRII